MAGLTFLRYAELQRQGVHVGSRLGKSMNLLERAKEHWLVGVALVFCAGASVALWVAFLIFVQPRDFELQRQQNELQRQQRAIDELRLQVQTLTAPRVAETRPADAVVVPDSQPRLAEPPAPRVVQATVAILPEPEPEPEIDPEVKRLLTGPHPVRSILAALGKLPPLDRERVVERDYVGQEVANWVGLFETAHTNTNGTISVMLSEPDTDASVWAEVPKDLRQTVELLRKGDRVVFSGTITSWDGLYNSILVSDFRVRR